MNFFLPLTLALSFSVQEPKELPNPFNYEISTTVQKADKYYLDFDYERENGIMFVDHEEWYEQHWKNLIFKEKYYNKTSHNQVYNQIDLRYAVSSLSLGYALRHEKSIPDHRLVAVYSDGVAVNFFLTRLEADMSVELSANLQNVDYLFNAQTKFALLTNVSVSGLARWEKIGDKVIPQIKFGIEVNMPSFAK